MIVSMKPKLKMFLFLVLPVGTAYSQECKVLERESYSKPLFSLSRFSKECSEQKRMASATWDFIVEQENERKVFVQDHPVEALFEVVPDPDSVYDCSKREYSISQSDFSMSYTIYANSDALNIRLGSITYGISTIDGGCDVHLGQLCQRFREKNGRETLVLTVIDDMILKEKKSPRKTEKGKSLILKRGSSFAVTVNYFADLK